MIIKNNTRFSMSTALKEAVADYPTDGLIIELKYSPMGSRRYISGTYYRRATNFENGKLIRLRINRANRYPIAVPFKTSDYEKKNVKGQISVYQKMRVEKFQTPEDLILAIFLHEFSHYLDHIEGLNGRYKQTKADKFAVSMLEKLEVIARK
ncbi:MAG: hypothetical protein ABFD54_16615 [Armatimonadota bacterium]|nr:hypothetical protein [bacterium]